MIIYKDVFSGDELISDSFKMETVNSAIFKVASKMVTKKDEGDYGISSNEDPEEGGSGGAGDSSAETVDQIADNFKYNQTYGFDEKSYLGYLKGYLGRIVEHLNKTNPSRVDGFKKDVQAFMVQMRKEFADWEFYLGESNDGDAMIVLRKFAEDGLTPYMYYFKDGLKEEKM